MTVRSEADLTALTDLDIVFNGTIVEELKDVGPEDAFPFLRAAILGAQLGQEVELRFGNPVVYEMASAAFDGRLDTLKVTLKAA